MSSGMKIRTATVADKPVWLALRRRLRPTLGDQQHERDWQQMMGERARRATLLCVDAQGGLLGMIEVSQRGPEEGFGAGPLAWIDAFHVEQGEEHAAAARRLADAAAGWGRARGCRALASDTSVDNQWAQKLHRELGFEEVARKVVYRKVLAAPEAAPAPPAAPPGPRPVPVPVSEVPEEGLQPVTDTGVPGWWPGPVRAGIIVLGILSFYFTDVFSGDVFVGVVLPIVDVVFVIYLLLLFVGMKYRRRMDAGDRELELYRAPHDSD